MKRGLPSKSNKVPKGTRLLKGTTGWWVIQEDKVLGVGSQAAIVLGENLSTGQKAAVKVFEKTQDCVSFWREEKALKTVSHPNIPQLLEVLEDKDAKYLLTEYVQGQDMCNFVNQHNGVLPEAVIRSLFWQVLCAVSACHQAGVVHRDVKLDNVLVDVAEKRAYLIDFGLSTFVSSEDQLLTTYCGSPLYAAPELVERTPYNGKLCDVWSCGVILYTLVCGKLPFFHENKKVLFKLISEHKPDIPSTVPDWMRCLLTQMLAKRPSQRPSINEVMRHPWFYECTLPPAPRVPTRLTTFLAKVTQTPSRVTPSSAAASNPHRMHEPQVVPQSVMGSPQPSPMHDVNRVVGLVGCV